MFFNVDFTSHLNFFTYHISQCALPTLAANEPCIYKATLHIATETNISCHCPMIGLFWFSRLSFSQSSENCLVTLSNTNIILLPCDLKKSRLLRKDSQKFMIVIPIYISNVMSKTWNVNFNYFFNWEGKKFPIFW